jgi:hypothetical protein
MKFFTAIGGFLGFALVMAVGLAVGRRSASLLLEASVACVIGGMLFRWWHRMLLQGVKASIDDRKRVEAEARRAEAAANPTATSRANVQPFR